MNAQKQFIREFPEKLKRISPDAQPLFGKMNPQQMVEHMAEYIRLGYGNPVVTESFYAPEATEKLHAFLRSDKNFRENTPNPLMSETPAATVHTDYATAVADVAKAVTELFEAFERQPELKVANPFFGLLDEELSYHLLAKHATHHLRQFPGIS
ncbi:MAG: hypothetical protein QM743_00340 [Chitinophagaceae bacterium]